MRFTIYIVHIICIDKLIYDAAMRTMYRIHIRQCRHCKKKKVFHVWQVLSCTTTGIPSIRYNFIGLYVLGGRRKDKDVKLNSLFR